MAILRTSLHHSDKLYLTPWELLKLLFGRPVRVAALDIYLMVGYERKTSP